MNRRKLCLTAVTLCCSLLGMSVYARNTTNPDDKRPLEVESNYFKYNHQTGVAVYKGHVIASQGSRHLTADTLTLFRDKNGQIRQIIAVGNPAQMDLKTAPDKPLTHSEALKIEYHEDTQYLNLLEKAKLTQNQDKYEASRIDYDIQHEIVHSPESEKGRIKIVLHSNNE